MGETLWVALCIGAVVLAVVFWSTRDSRAANQQAREASEREAAAKARAADEWRDFETQFPKQAAEQEKIIAAVRAVPVEQWVWNGGEVSSGYAARLPSGMVMGISHQCIRVDHDENGDHETWTVMLEIDGVRFCGSYSDRVVADLWRQLEYIRQAPKRASQQAAVEQKAREVQAAAEREAAHRRDILNRL